MSVRIVTDSTTDITQEEAARLGITVVPLKSYIAGTEYHQGIDLFVDEFYAMLAEADELPTTSQPSPHAFERVFRPALDAGEQILVITIAEPLSGTFQSACIAAETCGGDITIIDSGQTCLSQSILVYRAIQLRDAGLTATDIVETLEREKGRIHLLAVFDTLEYLYKGGRLSRTSAFAGSLLNVKPLVTIEDSQIVPIAKCRGTAKAYEEVFARIEDAGGIDPALPVAIGYTGDREKFERFEALIRERYPDLALLVFSIGCVVGTHAGPGAVALAFFSPEA